MRAQVAPLARAVLVLGLLLLAAPLATAADFGAVRAQGTGGALVSTDAFLFAQAPAAESFEFTLASTAGDWQVVDEVILNVVRSPFGQNSIYAEEGERRIFDGSLSASSAWSEATRPGARLVVTSAGGGYSASGTAEQTFSVAPAPETVVENSHSISNTTPSSAVAPNPFEYYEYRSPEGLQWTSGSGLSLHLTGDFDVYLWDVDFRIAGADGAGPHTTGFSSEPRSDTNGLTADDHYRYAILQVRAGSMTVSASGGSLSMVAPTIDAQETTSFSFEQAEGRIPTTDGVIDATGTVTTNDGSFVLQYRSGGMDVDVTKAPATAAGPHTSFTPTPLSDHPWFMPAIFGALAMVGLCATAYTYPTLHGALHLRRMEALTGRPRARGWRAARAEGYALRAAAAEDSGHMRLASVWMSLASRIDPHDPEKSLDAGIFLAARGRNRRALRHFETAHRGFFEAGDVENLAHNAYEAAKASSRLERRHEALDWLRIAAQADPGLLQDIRLEPAFHALRDEPDYSSLTVGDGK